MHLQEILTIFYDLSLDCVWADISVYQICSALINSRQIKQRALIIVCEQIQVYEIIKVRLTIAQHTQKKK